MTGLLLFLAALLVAWVVLSIVALCSYWAVENWLDGR